MSGEAAARAFAGRRHGVVIGDDAVTAARGDAEVPFADCGPGRELGAHALAAYTELKSMFVAL